MVADMPRTHKVKAEVLDSVREESRKIIQRMMLDKDLTYRDLARLLNEVGVEENERNLRNKVARGEFSAAYMLLCLKVMGEADIPTADRVKYFVEQVEQEKSEASHRKPK